MKTGAAYALLVVMATALGTAFTDSPPRPPPPPPPPSGLEPPPPPPCLEARSLHLPAPPPPPPSYPSGGTPFLEYGPPPGRTTPPPPPEKHLKYEAIGEPHIKWSPHHINVLYAPAPVAYSPPPPPPPPTLPPYKYQTARPLPAPPVTSSPPVTYPPQKPAVRPHLEYGPPPQVEEHQPSPPAPPPPPPPPQLPYASTGQAALPEPTHRFSLQPTQHHAARHFVKRAADNAIDTYIYRYVDDGSSFNKYGQLQLNAHDKTLGKFAYRYVGSDGVTVDVSRRPA